MELKLDESLIKRRQQWVLLRPCLAYQECAREGYTAFIHDGPIHLMSVFTIDLFTQPWAWHSLAGVVGSDGTAKPRAQWSTRERLAVVDYARRMLDGIGEGELRIELDRLSFGFARTLTVSETVIATSRQGNAPASTVVGVGEINEYDFSDVKTRAGDHLHIPKTRSVIYGRAN